MLKKIFLLVLLLNGVFIYSMDIYWNGELYNSYSTKDLDLISGGEFKDKPDPVSIPLWYLTPLTNNITEFSSIRNTSRYESRGEELKKIFPSLTFKRDNEGDWFLSWNKENLALPEEIFLKGSSIEEENLLLWLPLEMSWLKPEIDLFAKTHRLQISVEIIELIPESLSRRYIENRAVPDAVFMNVSDLSRYKGKLSSLPISSKLFNQIEPAFLSETLLNQEIFNKPGIPLFFSIYGIFTKKGNKQILIEDKNIPMIAGNIYNPKWVLMPNKLNRQLIAEGLNTTLPEAQKTTAEENILFIREKIKSGNYLISADPENLLNQGKTQSIIIDTYNIKDINSIVPLKSLWYPILSPFYLTFPIFQTENQSEVLSNPLLPFLSQYLADFNVQAQTMPQHGIFPTNRFALANRDLEQSIATEAVSAILAGRGEIISPSKEWLQFNELYIRIVGIILNNQINEVDIEKLYKELEEIKYKSK